MVNIRINPIPVQLENSQTINFATMVVHHVVSVGGQWEYALFDVNSGYNIYRETLQEATFVALRQQCFPLPWRQRDASLTKCT
jgi:hypothetical protein